MTPSRLGLSLAALLLAIPPAAAQVGPGPTGPPDKCQLRQNRDDGGPANPVKPDTLTETLDGCEGVIRPPAVGDAPIAKPPPVGSKTPVLKPEGIP
jgi:hypothetical protein